MKRDTFHVRVVFLNTSCDHNYENGIVLFSTFILIYQTMFTIKTTNPYIFKQTFKSRSATTSIAIGDYLEPVLDVIHVAVPQPHYL